MNEKEQEQISELAARIRAGLEDHYYGGTAVTSGFWESCISDCMEIEKLAARQK
jgi:hypothetical protein